MLVKQTRIRQQPVKYHTGANVVAADMNFNILKHKIRTPCNCIAITQLPTSSRKTKTFISYTNTSTKQQGCKMISKLVAFLYLIVSVHSCSSSQQRSVSSPDLQALLRKANAKLNPAWDPILVSLSAIISCGLKLLHRKTPPNLVTKQTSMWHTTQVYIIGSHQQLLGCHVRFTQHPLWYKKYKRYHSIKNLTKSMGLIVTSL